ncbi:hypothetical protein G6N82_09150 [Altererythrobacter sp. BO-6]|uniref:hypothetical protein n=1 Tax=Altererythrobacter sp. BO-6 TaxID=2604537 RepID=UPI0013E158AF|nr:hypothetical protein [Altererythrobacter sp. BO-6]QIG54290.1 hypothetical protein G6N82_09150 [Altererythrobacter sp. BO-6]
MMFDTRLTIPEQQAGSQGKALRAFGWHELTARINAARDLRQVLREDTCLLTASFGDAAAGYFSGSGQGKRSVNPDALGAGKACDGMEPGSQGEAATGDREI